MAHAQGSLGEFLTSRRSRLDPRAFGISPDARRRVAGLRREEVAAFVGVSVEYYARLERGRATRPSSQVVEALARTFDLSPAEQRHLFELAGVARRVPTGDRVRTGLAELVDAIAVPGVVINHRFDVLAANVLGRVLLVGPPSADMDATENLARRLFLDPAARSVYRDWDEVARATAGQLRATSARYPDDVELTRLVEDFTRRCPQFAEYWATGDVELRSHGIKRLWHAEIGDLVLTYENLDLPGDDAVRVVLFRAEPGSADDDKLRLLSSLAAELRT